MKNKEQLDSYNATGHLLNKKIVCTKCTTHITCFGSNLKSKISKYGGIETLLDTFTCRTCTGAAKPKKVQKPVKAKKEKKTSESEIDHKSIPKLQPYVSREVSLKDAPELVQELTSNGTCIRPDIFLDSGKVCDHCPYKGECQAAMKCLKKAA